MKRKVKNILVGAIVLILVTISILFSTRVTFAANYSFPNSVIWDEEFKDLIGWKLPSAAAGYYKLELSGDMAYLYESPGKYPTNVYVTHSLDLSSWTGNSPFTLKVKFRAQSNTAASSVTQFRIGIQDAAGNTLWSHYEYFSSTDSGFRIWTFNISASEVPVSSALVIYFGFRDAWIANWYQRVTVDYIKITGERKIHTDLVTYDYFNYDADVVSHYWSLAEASQSYHKVTVGSGYLTVSESSGKYHTAAYVYGTLDLNSWTGEGDLKITVRIRAQSDYSGSSIVTQFRMGITTIDNTVLWSYYKYWKYTKDTGWVTLTVTIPESDIQKGATYKFYWGYYDSWSADWNQKVSIDYFQIYGDKYIEGVLENNYAGITTKEHSYSFVTDCEGKDYDKVGIVFSTTASFDNSLGQGDDSTPIIESAIAIGMNDDKYHESGFGYWTDYWTEVDKVTVKIEIRDAWSGSLISDTPTIEYVYVNEEDNDGTETQLAYDIINLLIDAIGLIPKVGSYISFGAKLYMFAFQHTTSVGENTLTQSHSAGVAEATFDYSNSHYVFGLGYWPGDGSTDFKMKLKINPSLSSNGGIYRIKTTYTVTLKHVEWSWFADFSGNTSGSYICQESFETHTYTETFDYIHYPNNNRVGVVDLSSNVITSDALSISAASGTDVFPTVNGNDWYVVVGSTNSYSVTITAKNYYTAPDYKTYQFDIYKIIYWQPTIINKEDQIYVDRIIACSLTPDVLYYKFQANYILMSDGPI